MTAGDIFFVECAACGIIDQPRVLVFVRDAQVEVAVDAFQELGIDKILFLAEWCFGAELGVITQAPEIVRVVTMDFATSASIELRTSE